MTETKGRLSGHARRQRGAASDLADVNVLLNKLYDGGALLRIAVELVSEAGDLVDAAVKRVEGARSELTGEITERVERKDDDT